MILEVSRGGVFEVSLDDTLVVSKERTGKHTPNEDIVRALKEQLAG